MNSLEFIEKEIATTKSKYKEYIKYNQTSFAIKDEKKLKILQQIKNELKAWEIVKSSIKHIKEQRCFVIHNIFANAQYKYIYNALEVKDE